MRLATAQWWRALQREPSLPRPEEAAAWRARGEQCAARARAHAAVGNATAESDELDDATYMYIRAQEPLAAATALRRWAALSVSRGEPHTAALAMQRVVALMPGSDVPHLDLARHYLALSSQTRCPGQRAVVLAAALAAGNSALALRPAADTWDLLAVIHRALGAPQAAVTAAAAAAAARAVCVAPAPDAGDVHPRRAPAPCERATATPVKAKGAPRLGVRAAAGTSKPRTVRRYRLTPAGARSRSRPDETAATHARARPSQPHRTRPDAPFVRPAPPPDTSAAAWCARAWSYEDTASSHVSQTDTAPRALGPPGDTVDVLYAAFAAWG